MKKQRNIENNPSHLMIHYTLQLLFLLTALLITNVGTAQEPIYDRFGGHLDLHIDDGNGYFRLGEINGKHFLVTPEGNAFRAIGINHTHMNTRTDYDNIIAELKALGFNSGDYQGPAWMWNRIPYSKGLQLLDISGWLPESQFRFEDVFDPDFLASLELKIKSIVQPQANNEMLICYFLTDVPVWEIEKYGTGWIDFYKSLDGNSAGGQEWNAWKTANPTADEQEFIHLIARQLYSKATGFIRKYDKNHLIFSDRYIEYHFPESALEEALPYVDGIAIQPKNFLTIEFYEEVYRKYKKPIFIADHVTSHATEEYPNTMGQVADNPEDYLAYYRSSVYDILSLPFAVGYNKCQYMDQVNDTQLKQGLYRQSGEPYEYVSGLNMAHQRTLDTAYTVPPPPLDRGLQHWGAYEGIKQEAARRIDTYRKGDTRLKVYLPNLDTAANTRVRAKLKRHDFKWGAAVRESFVTSPYSNVYKETFLKYFNATGFGIALKPKWRGSTVEYTTETVSMPWFLNHDIYVRGHTLAWEGINFIRPEQKAIYEDPDLTQEEKADTLLKSFEVHFRHAIPKWDVRCWDVSNEPINNNLINDLFPDMNTHVHWFKLSDSIRRAHGKEDVVLYQNDYQIISAILPWALSFRKEGYDAVGRPALYREILDEQITLGAPIEGIGFQSRLKGGLITPDTIYKRLCDFERFNLPYQATEFEIRDGGNDYTYTDEERRLLTEYMMVMYFSHPKVNGFWHWTFSDVRSTDNWDYSLFNYDGTPKVNGQVWMDLMDGFFTTDEVLKTDSLGELDLRGYYGRYELIAEIGDEVLIGTFDIDSTLTEPTQRVYLDKGISLSGLEDGAAYDLDKPIDIEVSAFSNHGDIASIGLFLEYDSIGGAADSAFSMTFTPTSNVEGWNEVTARIYDESGNHFSYSMDIYFGDKLPVIEILSTPADTILTGSTGNDISFKVEETYSEIKSIYIKYAGDDLIFPDTSGTFFFNVDPIGEGYYEFIIQVVDNIGGETHDTIAFTAITNENQIPVIEITSPQDSSIIKYGSEDILAIEASDPDGNISSVMVYLNGNLTFTFRSAPYSIGLNRMSIGDFDLVAEAVDDRGGTAADSIFISITDSTVSSVQQLNTEALIVYPNPVKHTLRFGKKCDYAIFTLRGMKLLEGRGSFQADVSSLSQGMYIVKTNHGVSKLRKE
jgi:GH35 family endo-1,4-beta-xylanase